MCRSKARAKEPTPQLGSLFRRGPLLPCAMPGAAARLCRASPHGASALQLQGGEARGPECRVGAPEKWIAWADTPSCPTGNPWPQRVHAVQGTDPSSLLPPQAGLSSAAEG